MYVPIGALLIAILIFIPGSFRILAWIAFGFISLCVGAFLFYLVLPTFPVH